MSSCQNNDFGQAQKKTRDRKQDEKYIEQNIDVTRMRQEILRTAKKNIPD